MLASLLCNIPVAHAKRERPERWYDRFVTFEGETYDTEDRPEKRTVKRIAKAIAKIDLPKEVRTEASSLTEQLLDNRARQSAERRIADVIAYRRLAELLKIHVQETEEAALLMLLLEI